MDKSRIVWTEDLVAQATSLRNDGHSAEKIAARFGATRSAVLGMFHRHGVRAPEGGQRRGGRMRSAAMSAAAGVAKPLPSLKDASIGPRVVANSSKVRQVQRARAGGAAGGRFEHEARPLPKQASAAGRTLDADRLPHAVSLAELQTGDCRFAVTAHDVPPHEHRFCGLPVADLTAPPLKAARRYCQHHMKRVVAVRDEHGHGAGR